MSAAVVPEELGLGQDRQACWPFWSWQAGTWSRLTGSWSPCGCRRIVDAGRLALRVRGCWGDLGGRVRRSSTTPSARSRRRSCTGACRGRSVPIGALFLGFLAAVLVSEDLGPEAFGPTARSSSNPAGASHHRTAARVPDSATVAHSATTAGRRKPVPRHGRYGAVCEHDRDFSRCRGNHRGSCDARDAARRGFRHGAATTTKALRPAGATDGRTIRAREVIRERACPQCPEVPPQAEGQ